MGESTEKAYNSKIPESRLSEMMAHEHVRFNHRTLLSKHNIQHISICSYLTNYHTNLKWIFSWNHLLRCNLIFNHRSQYIKMTLVWKGFVTYGLCYCINILKQKCFSYYGAMCSAICSFVFQGSTTSYQRKSSLLIMTIRLFT